MGVRRPCVCTSSGFAYLKWGPVKFLDKNNKIIPNFKDQSIQGIKQLDYQDFCEIATLMVEVKHLSPMGIAKIQLIKDRMNTKRK